MPDGQGPGGFAQPQYPGAVPGGQGHHLGGGHERRVTAPDLVEPGRQAHFAPEVQVVVGGGPIRPQPHRHPELEQSGDGRDAGGQLQIAFGTVADFHAPAGQEFLVAGRKPHGMDRHRQVIQDAQMVEVGARGPAGAAL